MTLEEFRRRVRLQFGPGMQHATPENVREFLDRMQEELDPTPRGGPYVLNEPEATYEAILRRFFVEVLDSPRDQALIQLWMLAFELSFSGIREVAEQEVAPLFAPWSET